MHSNLTNPHSSLQQNTSATDKRQAKIDGPQTAHRGRCRAGATGPVPAGAGVRAGRGYVVHGVAYHQLHAVPGLHHQQQQRGRVVADGGMLPVYGGGGEREHELRLPHPHRQRAARSADQPDTRRHAAQGLQLHGRPASVQRCLLQFSPPPFQNTARNFLVFRKSREL